MADNDEGNGADNEEFTDDLDVDDGALEQTNKQQITSQLTENLTEVQANNHSTVRRLSFSVLGLWLRAHLVCCSILCVCVRV